MPVNTMTGLDNMIGQFEEYKKTHPGAMVKDFANHLGVHPSTVYSRMQNERGRAARQAQTRAKKEPTLVTVPISEPAPTEVKVALMTGSADQIKEVLKGWIQWRD